MARANLSTLVLLPLLVAILLVPYACLWSGRALLNGVDRFSLPIMLLAFAASVVVHEALRSRLTSDSVSRS